MILDTSALHIDDFIDAKRTCVCNALQRVKMAP
jgi:hypothetical protein